MTEDELPSLKGQCEGIPAGAYLLIRALEVHGNVEVPLVGVEHLLGHGEGRHVLSNQVEHEELEQTCRSSTWKYVSMMTIMMNVKGMEYTSGNTAAESNAKGDDEAESLVASLSLLLREKLGSGLAEDEVILSLDGSGDDT